MTASQEQIETIYGQRERLRQIERELPAALATAARPSFQLDPATVQCPACEAGYHNENADGFHLAFACACPCNGMAH